jgi:hypothetical protein
MNGTYIEVFTFKLSYILRCVTISIDKICKGYDFVLLSTYKISDLFLLEIIAFYNI